MADADNGNSHDGHHDDHHGPEYLAHHFETTEQQYDASKLGIWIFLVTEVLFFSGLFCAYTLYRYHHPEIFAEASQYLDTAMGAINTAVLLFSSLTMAWAVRCAQLGNNKGVATNVLITITCAFVFLGIKAVEYTHKWDLGIFVRSAFDYHETAHHGISTYLVWLSVPFAISLVAFIGLAVFFKGTGSNLWAKFCAGMILGCAGYFVGVGAGLAYEPIKAAFVGAEEHGSEHSEDGHGEEAHADDSHGDDEGHDDEGHDDEGHDEESEAEAVDGLEVQVTSEAEQSRNIGVFFSIYYFMTGLHGIHVLGGIIALAWLFYRSLRGDFKPDYFGPVDNVGLYWHLVDLIWIYLFPLLYLIGS